MFGLSQEDKKLLNYLKDKIESIEYYFKHMESSWIVEHFNKKIDRLGVEIENLRKEIKNEKSKKKLKVKVRKGKEAPQGGHEDVSKGKRGRPKVVKKAQEVK